VRDPVPSDRDSRIGQRSTLGEQQGAKSGRPMIEIGASRWADFRRLCLYYAECVRLDQRSSIHAKADEENEGIVCLDGRLPQSGSIVVRTSNEWQQFMQSAANSDYLFVGYPLHRYQWKDTTTS